VTDFHSKSLICDLDGTLFESSSSVKSSLIHALSQNNLPVPATFASRLIGPPLHELISRSIPNPDPEIIEQVKISFAAHYDQNCIYECSLYPSVTESLRRLKDLGLTIHICTNKRQKPTNLLLDYFDLTPLFDLVVCSDTLKKPFSSKGDALKYLLKLASQNPFYSFYLGDTYSDFLACTECSITFLWASWGYYEVEKIEELSATRKLTNFSDIFTILQDLH